MRRTRGVPTHSEVSEVLKTREILGGAPTKRRTDPKEKEAGFLDYCNENFTVYTEETIYVMKETIHVENMVDDLYLKFVIPVTTTGRNSPF